MAAGSVVIDDLVSFAVGSQETTHIPGDLVRMENPEDYVAKAMANGKITIAYLGENAIYVGDGKYSGLGMLNYTEANLRAALLAGYNADTGENKDEDWADTNIVFKPSYHGRINISAKVE